MGKWRVKIYFKQLVKEKVKTGLSVGGDLGVSYFLTLSLKSFRFLNPVRSLDTKDLSRIDRKISKVKETFPDNYKTLPEYTRLIRIRSNIYKRVKNRNKNTFLTWVNQLTDFFDTIYLEDLNKLEMFKTGNKFLRSKLQKVSWKQFLGILSYKAEYAGKKVTLVNPAYTSQTCSNCHTRLTQPLEDYHTFKCRKCGLTIDRDYNAAKNITQVGMGKLKLA